MALAEIPLDVILEVTSFLDLHDSVHFVTTCSSFESLLSSKDFWLKTLNRIRKIHMQPLPCPVGTTITDMPIETLRKLAIRAYCLKKNWSSERALPVSVRTIALGQDYPQICVIPGTNIIVTNSNDRLACWHTQSGACIGVMEHEDTNASHQMGRSPPFHQPGRSFIALSSKSRTHIGLLLIMIDYRNEAVITISKAYSNALPASEFKPILTPDATCDDKTIGMVFTRYIDQLSMLVYCHFSDGIIHRVPLSMRLGGLPACVLHDGHFYIHGQDLDDPSIVIRVPIDHSRLPVVEFDRTTLSTYADVETTCIALGDPWLLPPTYGVSLVTRRTSEMHSNGHIQRLRSVHFWPASDHPHATARLNIGDLVSYEHHSEIMGLAVGISGRYAALLDDGGPRQIARRWKNNLGIVHYAAHPRPRTSFHLLDTAGVVIKSYTAVLALDDALGIVYITHIGEGATATLSVLSYA